MTRLDAAAWERGHTDGWRDACPPDWAGIELWVPGEDNLLLKSYWIGRRDGQRRRAEKEARKA